MFKAPYDFLFVLLVAAFCFFFNLGGADLWDRDETRNARCAVEMLEANDWVVPTFNAELREHKPALTYWGMMLSYMVFGVNEFSARFPSALYGLATVALTFWIGNRIATRKTAFWAAIGLSTSMMFGVASRAATPDAPLIFFTTLSLAIYVYGCTTTNQESETPWVTYFPAAWPIVVAMYTAMGFAVLAKGPIGLVLPTAIIGMFLLIKWLPARVNDVEGEKTWLRRIIRIISPFAPLHFLKTCWRMRPLTALGCAIVVALPWYLAVHYATEGKWTYGFFVKHNVGRAMNSMDGHRGNILFYPVSIIVGFFPFSIFWLPALLDGIKRLRSKAEMNDGLLFAFCWVGVYLGLFTIAKTKLPSYITPCYPGVALAIGMFHDCWTSNSIELKPAWPKFYYGSLPVIGLLIMITVPIVAQFYVPGEMILGLLGFIPFIGGLLALKFALQQQTEKSVFATACMSVLFSVALFGVAAERVGRHRQLDRLVELMYQGRPHEEVDVFSFAETEASWVFYARQPVEVITDPVIAAKMLHQKSQSGQRRALVTSQEKFASMKQFLPGGSYKVEAIPYFMEETDLLVVHPNVKRTNDMRPVRIATVVTDQRQ